ncbi:MAG: alanine racemase [bacterium]|nr:alanine racemase [bacterium]
MRNRQPHRLPQLTWIEISQSALEHNLKNFRKLAGRSPLLMPVVKGNAYGHGLAAIAQIVQKQADWLAVVNVGEALALRQAGVRKKLMVLGFFDPNQISLAVGKNIVLPVYTLTMAKQISAAAQAKRKTFPVHVKLDVGTSRLGLRPEKTLAFLRQIKKLPGLRIEGAYSHLADSENFDQKYTKLQVEIFTKTLELFEEVNIKLRYRHLACSAATLINSQTRFDILRIGIGLYGLWPSIETKKLYEKKFNHFTLQPVLSWHTRVIQIKQVPKNTFIGYGCSYRARRDTRIAVIPVGYWDGYDRGLSNRGEVLIRGKRRPVLGRVCMNMLMLDVTDRPNVRVGDIATLIGQQGKESISAEELAEKAQTIHYEIVTRIQPELPRIIV